MKLEQEAWHQKHHTHSNEKRDVPLLSLLFITE